MRNDRRRKPLDLEALRAFKWTRTLRGRYRVVLTLNPKLPKPRIKRAFSRWLTLIIDGHDEIWKDNRGLIALEIARLRKSRKKWERSPAHISTVVGLSVSEVERMIYKKPAL